MKMDPTTNVTMFKAGLDLSSFGIVVGAFAGYLPPIAAALSVIWTAIQITEWYLRKLRRR